MTDKEILSTIMKEDGFTLATLSEKLGYKTTSGVSERLRVKNAMRVDVFFKFLEAMDCEVVVRSKKKGHKEYKVDFPDGSND